MIVLPKFLHVLVFFLNYYYYYYRNNIKLTKTFPKQRFVVNSSLSIWQHAECECNEDRRVWVRSLVSSDQIDTSTFVLFFSILGLLGPV